MEDSKKTLRSYGMEFLTVILGILIAFGLNSAYESSQEKDRANQCLESILDEVEGNRKHIKQRLEYHEELLNSLRKDPLATKIILKLSRLKSHAWELSQTDIFRKHVGYTDFLDLSEIYSMQDRLNRNNSSASQLMSELNVLGPFYEGAVHREFLENDKFRTYRRQGWIPIFEDITSWESEIFNKYTDVLKKHGKKLD